MMKPALIHAQTLAQYLNKCGNMYIIQIALKELGVSSSCEGFQYAKFAVSLLCDNPTSTLTNGIYLSVGMIGNPPAGEAQVEQAIRSAIRKAWKDRDERIWSCYFPVGKIGRYVCPSNRDFLMAVVDFVELWKGFCEEVNYGK